jgi:hypothetical protein
MERLTREAGVDLTAVKVTPGHELLAATGASAPSGVAVPEEKVRRILEGDKRGRRPGGQGHGAGRQGQRGAAHRGPRGGRAFRGERGERSPRPGSARAPRD